MKTLLSIVGMILFAGCAIASDIQVFFNHDGLPPARKADLEQKIIEVIDTAETTLDAAVYDLDLPGIAQAMANAKSRGVTVRFITDEDNIGAENSTALGILDANAIPWIDDTENGSAGSKIQHNKFLIIDGETVLTGSTNFTQSGIHGDLINGNLVSQGNDNHIVIIQSQQLASVFTTQFNIMWGDGPGGALDSLFGLGKPDHQMETVYTTNEQIRIDVQFTPQSPTVFAGSSIENLGNLLGTAQSRIRVAQFAFSAQDLADVMKLRHDVGVEVQGIGDSSFFYRYFSEFQDMAGIELPNNNGVPETDSFTGLPNNPWNNPADVRVANLDAGDKWHHKYFIIDDVVVTGSHNASGAAAFGNDENVVVIYDPVVAAQFEGHFSRAFCNADPQNCTSSSPAGGIWEGVTFSSEEVVEVLQMVNLAGFTELDVDAAMNKRAVENIFNNRPILTMEQLSAVPYIGSAALNDLKDYTLIWE